MKTLLLLACAFALVLAGDASACSCGSRTLEQEIRETDAIFVGKVVRLEVAKVVDGTSTVEATIDVRRTFKGSVPATVVMTTHDGCCACQAWFEIARTYVFFAAASEGSFSTSVCTRTKLVGEAEEELKFLERSTRNQQE